MKRMSLRSIWLLAAAAAASASCDHKAHGTRHPRDHSSAVAARFPGAGNGGAALPIAAGSAVVSCDQPGPVPAGVSGPAPGAGASRECYFDAQHPDDPAAIMEWIVEAAAQGDVVHARLTFNPRFVDNTYGANAIGWNGGTAPAPAMMPMPKPGMPKPSKGGGHTFKDLVGSDHAEFTLRDTSGTIRLKFKADYLSANASAPSGYASLGVTGGEGKMLIGEADAVVAVSTSLDRNLNTCGYEDYLLDSPASDAHYSANPEAPNWDYRVVYDVWVGREAFGAEDFGRASVEFVHASPSKAGKNTIEVTPGDCPPGWPPYCKTPEECKDVPPTPPSRCGDEPDESCDDWPPCMGEGCPPTPDDVGTVY
jgi:hypothetical protein